MIIYIVSLTDIKEVGFKKSSTQRIDSRLKSGFMICLVINIVFISKMNVNSTLIVRILFSNGAEVNEVC